VSKQIAEGCYPME